MLRKIILLTLLKKKHVYNIYSNIKRFKCDHCPKKSNHIKNVNNHDIKCNLHILFLQFTVKEY